MRKRKILKVRKHKIFSEILDYFSFAKMWLNFLAFFWYEKNEKKNKKIKENCHSQKF